MAKRKTTAKSRSARSTKSSNKNKKINFASKYKRSTLVIFALVFANIGALTLVFSQASSSGLSNSVEVDQYNRINNHRASHGKGALYRSGCITDFARVHAKKMGDQRNLHHSNYGPGVSYACSDGSNWTAMAENVGKSYVGSGGLSASSASVFQAYLNSSGHHANIDDSSNYRFNFVGTAGYQNSYGELWTVHIYVTCTNCGGKWKSVPTNAGEPSSSTTSTATPAGADHAAVKRGNTYYLSAGHSGGTYKSFGFGDSSDIPVFCDWNGDGIDTPGVYRRSNSNFYISNQFTSFGASDSSKKQFSFGNGGLGDIPVCGDWNGDGIDTVGVYRPGESRFYLTDNFTSYGASTSKRTFTFGRGTTDIPVIGDWNGDGKDTVGVYRPKEGGRWYLTNEFSSYGSSTSKYTFLYGQTTGDEPITGDWNNNGKDTVGVQRGATFYLTNNTTGGATHYQFNFGRSSDQPLSGVWRK